ncbi:MAG TPA: hypothetical protein VFE65_15335 [Pseudonocardia sp.]|nr:hypothetical protein [Pseudonocardia sp.]
MARGARPRRVRRLDGPVLGTITNEILKEGGELELPFQFALAIRPGDRLPITEAQLSHEMVTAYRGGFETTLAAVRVRPREPARSPDGADADTRWR